MAGALRALGGRGAGPVERRAVVVLALVVAGASVVARILWPAPDREWIAESLAALGALVAVVYGYLQWRAGHHEESYERYYERLETVNRRFEEARLAEIEGRPAEVRDLRHVLFVFAELDTLEYVLGKHREGLVRRELTHRALRHFLRRGLAPDGERFGATVRFCLDRGAYGPDTRAVAERLLGTGSGPGVPGRGA